MGTVILISTVAIIVAIVGCATIWRLDASRAEEIDHTPAAQEPAPRAVSAPAPTHRRALGS